MLQILLVFLYTSGDNTKQAVFGPIAMFGNLVHECCAVRRSLVLLGSIGCASCVFCAYAVLSVCCILGGHIFSVFVQLHSACVDLILHGNCGLSAHAVHTCSRVISASGILDNKVRGLLDVKELSRNYDVSDSMW